MTALAIPHRVDPVVRRTIGSLDDVTTLPYLTPWEERDVRIAREATAPPRPNRATRRAAARKARR